jgi:flagellar hook assembly protein FlgD
MDNQQMAAQLAQFSQLDLTEQMTGQLSTMNGTMEKLNGSFEGAMTMARLDYAKSLLGRQVSFYDAELNSTVSGQVKRIQFSDGEPVLRVSAEIPGQGTQEYLLKLEGIEGIE